MEELTDELSRMVQDTTGIMPDQCDYYEDRTFLIAVTVNDRNFDKLHELDTVLKDWLEEKKEKKLPVNNITVTANFEIQ